MRVAFAVILLLYCGVAASTAAVNNDVALADDDAALKVEVASLRARLDALERRASDRDPVTPEGEGDLTNRMLLIDIKNALARWGTPKSSDYSGQLQLLIGQISERVTEMGVKIRVLESQTTADVQTPLNQISERVTQMGADIRVLKAQSTVDVETLQNMTRQLEQASQDAGASTFVRWGSSTCGGNASSLIYSGVVGGGDHAHTGAAVNFLCLTLTPRLSQQVPPFGFAPLYGGEYQTYDSHDQKDPVCAVCHAAFSATVMIPGTDTCTPGWRLQYSGFLMAGYYAHPAATEYICVDRVLETAHGSDSNQNGALLYFTKTVCGSLPCTPYVNNKVVTCAVCSK